MSKRHQSYALCKMRQCIFGQRVAPKPCVGNVQVFVYIPEVLNVSALPHLPIKLKKGQGLPSLSLMSAAIDKQPSRSKHIFLHTPSYDSMPQQTWANANLSLAGESLVIFGIVEARLVLVVLYFRILQTNAARLKWASLQSLSLSPNSQQTRLLTSWLQFPAGHVQ